MGMSGQRHAPAALTPGKTRNPLYGLTPRAGLEGRGKSHPPLGFDPRTVQSLATRYTDWAIPAQDTQMLEHKLFWPFRDFRTELDWIFLETAE